MIEGLDVYATLGVAPTASRAAITAAYRALARKYHPDVSGDETVMKRLNAAYETLRSEAGRMSDQEHPDSPASAADPNHAGPPPGPAYGPVITDGRYAGWSLGEIALVEERYLEWLARAPGGRYLRRDVEEILAELEQARIRRRRPSWTRGSRE